MAPKKGSEGQISEPSHENEENPHQKDGAAANPDQRIPANGQDNGQNIPPRFEVQNLTRIRFHSSSRKTNAQKRRSIQDNGGMWTCGAQLGNYATSLDMMPKGMIRSVLPKWRGHYSLNMVKRHFLHQEKRRAEAIAVEKLKGTSMGNLYFPGYMFGKAIVCSDATAEAARYGFIAVERPEDFLVLAIASLGKHVTEFNQTPEAEDVEGDIEIDVAQVIGKTPIVCDTLTKVEKPMIMPSSQSNKKNNQASYRQYSFDLAKADQLFDELLKQKFLTLSKGPDLERNAAIL
ncbi:hypothetical protein Vadar_012813 [Vaccinium darrowii]|uniref:Uncharacterized protein n=1 Tax=Vaccinium darrowii TaxID=229202 RepID=A0ACB7ZJW1_9ERIC|nr:hypothetical protein Vadar_012813 [Vaccinium darrowii]